MHGQDNLELFLIFLLAAVIAVPLSALVVLVLLVVVGVSATAQAVMAFQKISGLERDGDSARIHAMGDLDEAWMTAVQAAEQMHRIGQVACGMSAGCFEEGGYVAMTRGAFCADSR